VLVESVTMTAKGQGELRLRLDVPLGENLFAAEKAKSVEGR